MRRRRRLFAAPQGLLLVVALLKMVALLMVALLTVGLSVSAQAAAPAPADSALHVDTTACLGQPSAAAFLKALQVELADQRARPEYPVGHAGPSPPPTAGRIVACAIAQGRVALAVGETVTTIDVSDVPTVAQARTAAVAIGETLRWWRALPAPKRTESSESNELKVASLKAGVTSASELPTTHPITLEQQSNVALLGSVGELVLISRGAGRGPEHTLLWGGEMRVGWRVKREWLTGLSAGYLTTSHATAFGDARLHGVTLGLILDRTWTLPAAYSEWRWGLGLVGMHSTVAVQSNWGFEEPTVRRVSANVNGHLSFVGAIDATWFVMTSVEASRAVLGVALQAGGHDAISLYGWGLDVCAGLGHRF